MSGVYLVGGGTGALGRAVVQAALRSGASVIVPYRDPRKWEELRAAAPAGSVLLGGAAADDNLAAFLDDAVGQLGRLDGVAAVAGAWAGSGSFEQAAADEWSRMLRANLDSTAGLCRAALPHLLKQGGSIVTVGARSIEAGGAGMAAYAVAKAGVVQLTRALAAENRERGVRANCVLPATIDTPANRSAMPGASTAAWTSVEAIARVILFLLSPDSAAVTGAVLPVDGRA